MAIKAHSWSQAGSDHVASHISEKPARPRGLPCANHRETWPRIARALMATGNDRSGQVGFYSNIAYWQNSHINNSNCQIVQVIDTKCWLISAGQWTFLRRERIIGSAAFRSPSGYKVSRRMLPDFAWVFLFTDSPAEEVLSVVLVYSKIVEMTQPHIYMARLIGVFP